MRGIVRTKLMLHNHNDDGYDDEDDDGDDNGNEK